MYRIQVDPNLNADAYRNLSSAEQLYVEDKQLEVILVYKDESLLLAASNMIDRYWCGTIWFFNYPIKFDRTSYTAAIRTATGVRVAAFLGKHDKFVCGEDSGVLQIYEVVTNKETQLHELKCNGDSCQHDDSLTSISVFSSNTHFVSAGMDACIKIWDTTELTATASYNQAHLDEVSSVEAQPESESIFASISKDCETILWDTRKSKPALGVWKKNHCPLTAASWKPDDKNTIAVGGIDGSIAILDIRNTGSASVYESKPFLRSVHKLLYNPKNSNQLAGCCETGDIRVFNANSKYRSIFQNNDHKDFVRGLGWYKSQLITCSWDNSILRHSILF